MQGVIALTATSVALLAVSSFLMRRDPPEGVESSFTKPIKAWHVILGVAGVALVTALGALLSERVGIRPLSFAASAPDQAIAPWAVIGRGLLGGAALAVVFEVLSRVFFPRHIAEWTKPCRFGNWKRYLGAALGAGVSEELIYRLFLFPLLAWLLGLLWHTGDGVPTAGAMWSSLVVVAVLFGASHLPILSEMGGFTPVNVVKGLVLFSSAGLILGWVFWTSGIEAAMLAHAGGLLLGWLYCSVIEAVRADA